ncbi:MAG: Pr6Pr family membrane protein [Treponema sp.]|jgi:hypothetical protein|nr:Pr6Pr family membrane protein [Treponema sp.]
MYIKNRIAAMVFRILVLAACSVGLALNLFIRQSSFHSESLIYYTNLSNLLCFLYFIPLVARMAIHLRDDSNAAVTLFPRLKGAFTLMMTITMLVYHFVLMGGNVPAYDGTQRWLANALLHYAAPAMVILDWVLFDPRRVFRVFDPLLWLLIPLLYAIFTLIRAEVGGEMGGRGSRFPYFFLDVDAIGWGGMLAYVGAFAVVFAALGYIMLLLDRKVLR